MKQRAALQRRTPLRAKAKPPQQRPERVRAPVKRVEGGLRGVYRRIDEAAQPVVSRAPAAAKRRQRRSTPLEREHMGRVKRLACVLCAELGMQQERGTEVHHVREDQGGAQRAPNWVVCALCADCHRGARGIHGDRSLLRQAKCTEIDLLAWTLKALAEERA
jgi:hypothetical protein